METPNKSSTLKESSDSSTNEKGASALKWEVFITPAIPIVTSDRPADVQQTFFQAMASTLIYGDNDAVLVDAVLTDKQASDLADWIASKGKNLTTIYITHGHGDHWFGVGTILKRFPTTKVVATPDVIRVMRLNASPEFLNGAWEPNFPNQIPKELVIAVYNGVHLYLAESSAQTRQEWIAALNKIESLQPRVVVASHKQPENVDDPKIIQETRRYIRDFDRLAGTTKTTQELYDQMLELYPERINRGWALWGSARAVKP
jgi:hypothetical protein